jgi:translation initiation factor 4G
MSPMTPATPTRPPITKRKRPHETLHAQSLLLGLAFAAVWTPSNLMAPNLTEIALDFDMNESERDLYLGSYCALATGVLSFPVGAGIGILTDLVSRQRLFCITVAGGAFSAAATGLCTQYWQLFLARLLTGGFMSGSVPVVFSFLGDLFATEERNTASSGLTAMMGLGIIMGQVYAGMVGSTAGWQNAFFVSGAGTMVLAVLCLFLVQEPVRGGKEKVLQAMLKAGTRYDRKLTWARFWHAVRHNKSNTILLWQGFFSSLPWGIIFVFLNDFLSQERRFSVPDATYLVLLFGIGCACGGILGGYWGQLIQTRNRSYLPLFMSVTTVMGIFPFLGLLNSHFTDAHGPQGMLYAFSGGMIASLPSVNVRPCLINVNPPETRGASLTAANLLINLGRGFGPSCITLMGTIWHVDRKFSFNVTVS